MIDEKNYLYASLILIAVLCGWGFTNEMSRKPQATVVTQAPKAKAVKAASLQPKQPTKRMPTAMPKRTTKYIPTVLPAKKVSAKHPAVRKYASIARELPKKKTKLQ